MFHIPEGEASQFQVCAGGWFTVRAFLCFFWPMGWGGLGWGGVG